MNKYEWHSCHREEVRKRARQLYAKDRRNIGQIWPEYFDDAKGSPLFGKYLSKAVDELFAEATIDVSCEP